MQVRSTCLLIHLVFMFGCATTPYTNSVCTTSSKLITRNSSDPCRNFTVKHTTLWESDHITLLQKRKEKHFLITNKILFIEILYSKEYLSVSAWLKFFITRSKRKLIWHGQKNITNLFRINSVVIRLVSFDFCAYPFGFHV